MAFNFKIKQVSFVMFVAITFIFPGCCPTTSVHPLSNPGDLKFDERLLGAWQSVDDKSRVFLHVGKGKDNFTEIHFIEHESDGTIGNGTFIAFPSSIDEDNFLNIQQVPEGKIDGYIFVMYDLHENDRLSLFLSDDGVFKNAIQEGRLKGEITEKENVSDGEQGQIIKGTSSVRITDSTEHIVEFIKAYGKNNIFNNPIGTFERVVSKGSVRQGSAAP